MRPTALLLLAACAGSVLAPAAMAENPITLFGKQYNVQRFNYYADIHWPSPVFAGEELSIFESEGITYVGNNKLLMTADDIADVFIGNPDNWIIEIELVTDGSGAITGIQYSRTIATVDNSAYDPNPGGITVNTGNSGLGAGGNAVMCGNDGALFGFGFHSDNLGQLLEFPVGSGCVAASGGCNLDISNFNTNAEDVCFVPGFGARPDSFYVVNQDLGGLDSAGLEVWTTTGIRTSAFVTGGTADPGLEGAVMKGVTFIPNTPAAPEPLRVPGGALLVSFDRDFPALQAFAADGTFLGTEYLTTTGTPTGPSRIDNSGCSIRPHIESLAYDAVTGRIFLNNQGNLGSCNWLWILTPVETPAACPADYNRDTFLNLDDLGDFITDFYSSPAIPSGLQANAPTYADVSLGYGLPCEFAGNAPAPYASNAYRASGYRVGFSTDGGNSCPLDPSQPFPNLDNLNDYITFYYGEFSNPANGCNG